MRRLSLLPLLACLTAGPACVYWQSHEGVLISSDPLGAQIVIDGNDTGKTTPARLNIGGNFGTDHVVELKKPGYRTATRRLYQHTEGYTSRWNNGVYDFVMPPLPVFWTTGDVIVPFGIRGALIPSELYVPLDKTDAPLLGFDLLAAQAAERAAEQKATGSQQK